MPMSIFNLDYEVNLWKNFQQTNKHERKKALML